MNHNIAYVITAAVVVAILMVLKPVIAYTPHGIALPIVSAPANAKAPKNIDILPPWHATGKHLAWINVEYHQDQQSEKGARELAQFAAHLAQTQNANALKVKTVGYQPPQAQGEMLAMYVLRGIAVHDE